MCCCSKTWGFYCPYCKGVSCGIAQISVADNGDNTIVIVAGANNLLNTKDIQDGTQLLSKAAVAVFQFETPIETTIDALLLIKKINNKCVTIVNAAPAASNIDKRLYSLSDIFCVNESEAELMSGLPTSTVDQCKGALQWFLNVGCNIIIITLGKNGVVFASKDSKTPSHEPAEFVQNPVDTTGAGDVFIGALSFCLARYKDWSLNRKIRVSCSVAAASIMKAGTQSSFPSITELNSNLFTG
uniref:Carbohydrate kinase PfkB domain-containing protein n=1 Tax=Clastoptera arizonana TaxID=38151 RepID=A0A1B6CD85_9HEMI